MKLHSENFSDGQRMPERYAFGKPDVRDHMALSDNENPQLSWSGAPEGTRSFVITCIDVDVPTRADDVNQEGRSVPADLPRAEFVHWLMIDIPAQLTQIEAGACSAGITAHGKQSPNGPAGSRQGVNDYSSWFSQDPEMAGTYTGYDGPCPPWNDSLLHHYHFTIYAVDVEQLPLEGDFGLTELRVALEGHTLDQASIVGTYSLNPDLG